MSKSIWTRDWPTKPGRYWFYGYRHGRVSCGYDCDRVLLMVVVKKTGSGVVCIAEGHFLYKQEVEDAQFTDAILPELPEVE